MSEKSLHLTENNIELLKYLNSNSEKFFKHNELTDKGFDLSEDSYSLIRHLVKRDGYNHFNYIYKITPNGQGKLQELAKTENEELEEKYYKDKTVKLAEDANKKSHRANIISLWAIIVTSLLSIASLIISIISLVRGQG